MDIEKKRQQLREAEGSLARCERLMYRQRRIVMELELQGRSSGNISKVTSSGLREELWTARQTRLAA